MSDFLPALEAEIANLERSLASDPRFVKLQELRRVARLYSSGSKLHALLNLGIAMVGDAAQPAPVPTNPAPSPSTGTSAAAPTTTPEQEEDVIYPQIVGNSRHIHIDEDVAPPLSRKQAAAVREAVIRDVANMLEGRATPTRTSEIFEWVELLGHRLGGRDPQNNLSAILSKSEKFAAHGRSGWTLSSVSPTGEQAGVAADAT